MKTTKLFKSNLICDDTPLCTFDGSSGFLNVDKINAYVCLPRPQRELYLQSYNLVDELHVLKYSAVCFTGYVTNITITVTQDEVVTITEEELF